MKLYTRDDCVRSMYDEAPNVDTGNEGCVGILKPEVLKEEYRQAKYQLFCLVSGFGCYPEKMGNACFGYFCENNEYARCERFQFLGIANDEIAAKALAQLQKAREEGTKC